MRISDQAYNRHTVLKSVRGDGPISRTELTAITGLSAATITEVTAGLIQRGLIREQRATSSGRGRPRIELSIDPDGGLVIGAELLLADGKLSCSFVDLAGERRFACQIQLGAARPLAAFAAAIADALNAAIAQSPFDRAQITRIALALPAVIDARAGVVHWLTTYDEPPCPFADLIVERLGLPVTIESGPTALARAEHWFGQARSLENFSLFFIDLWVDAAQYATGAPRVGGNGFNSEIGHTKTDFSPDARPCLCGAKGCVAAYASIYGVLLGAGLLDGFDPRASEDLPEMFERLLDQADAGSEAALQAFAQAGAHLGFAVANHINAFDPENVLLLMENQRFLDHIRPTLEPTIAAQVFRPLLRRTRIHIGQPIDDWQWKGAAADALERMYLGG